MNMQTGDLQDIYRHRVLEHSRHPHNFGRPATVDQEATGLNPLCGDKLSVYLQLGVNTIRSITFEGTGCAICIASASIMTDALTGLPVNRALQMVANVQGMFSDGSPIEDIELQEMEALASVRRYPSRVKCAMLAWTTFTAALKGDTKPVSTEI
jgi:nitrogen fixation protein NifU and related proteins